MAGTSSSAPNVTNLALVSCYVLNLYWMGYLCTLALYLHSSHTVLHSHGMSELNHLKVQNKRNDEARTNETKGRDMKSSIQRMTMGNRVDCRLPAGFR